MEFTLREEALIRYAMSNANDMLEDALLNECANLEYRLCLLELGVNE